VAQLEKSAEKPWGEPGSQVPRGNSNSSRDPMRLRLSGFSEQLPLSRRNGRGVGPWKRPGAHQSRGAASLRAWSMAFLIKRESGSVAGAQRPTSVPSRPIRNFAKFHSTFPGFTGCVVNQW